MSFKKKTPLHKKSEKSFTLIETLIALGIMVTLVFQIAIVQGQAINFSDYSKQMTKAVWLGKSLLSQIDYYKEVLTPKEMKYDQKEQSFHELLCPKDGAEPCEFTYNLKIENWKLDLIDIFFRNKQPSKGEDGALDDDPMIGMVKDQLKQQLGDELISYAYLEVFWPEGARRNSVEFSYLLTNQISLDKMMQTLSPLKPEGAQEPPPPPKNNPKDGKESSEKKGDPEGSEDSFGEDDGGYDVP